MHDMKNIKNSKKRIELIFPKAEQNILRELGINKSGEKTMKNFVATIDEVTKWFKQYEIDSINLWISGVIQSGSVLKLILNMQGGGGIMLTLKPKNSPTKT